MLFLGIDPGKDGGLVLIKQDGSIVRKWKTPLIKSAKARDEYDLPAIRDIIQSCVNAIDDQRLVVVLEKTQPLPPKMGGSAANYQRGLAFGIYQAMCVGMGLSYSVISPRTWQKAMFVNVNAEDTKAASVLVAKRLWPKEDWKQSERARKDDDGLTDAALIGEFGRRSFNTATIEAAAQVGVI